MAPYASSGQIVKLKYSRIKSFFPPKFIHMPRDPDLCFQNLRKCDVTAIAKHHDRVILLMFNPNWQLAQNMCKVGQERLSDSNRTTVMDICCLRVALVELLKRMPCFLLVQGVDRRSQQGNEPTVLGISFEWNDAKTELGWTPVRKTVGIASFYLCLSETVHTCSHHPVLWSCLASSLFQRFSFESVHLLWYSFLKHFIWIQCLTYCLRPMDQHHHKYKVATDLPRF